MWGDVGRYGEMWGDVGRCGETRVLRYRPLPSPAMNPHRPVLPTLLAPPCREQPSRRAVSESLPAPVSPASGAGTRASARASPKLRVMFGKRRTASFASLHCAHSIAFSRSGAGVGRSHTSPYLATSRHISPHLKGACVGRNSARWMDAAVGYQCDALALWLCHMHMHMHMHTTCACACA